LNFFCFSLQKITATVSGVSIINRGAMINCVAGDGSIGGTSGSISCCTTDRCNTGIALSNSFGLAIVTVAISVVLHAMVIG
jgi:hypothetical protein